ncbi:MAG: hypothetical protein M3010_13470, partial [Candidatus Dormibacteraeota bacterium]|nr:hypothetical protein [Candidatus Dormibacteraeota bacterium]
EYDLARFQHAAPLSLPSATRTVLLLDQGSLPLLGDRSQVTSIVFGRGWRMWVFHGSPDPVAFGRYVYLGADACPCRGATATKTAPPPGRPL